MSCEELVAHLLKALRVDQKEFSNLSNVVE